jgi:hypothetical protein
MRFKALVAAALLGLALAACQPSPEGGSDPQSEPSEAAAPSQAAAPEAPAASESPYTAPGY